MKGKKLQHKEKPESARQTEGEFQQVSEKRRSKSTSGEEAGGMALLAKKRIETAEGWKRRQQRALKEVEGSRRST